MRNYWNQLVCFNYATHRKIVKCEIKHILSPKTGKLHKITKAGFFAGLYFSLEDLFFPLYSHITPNPYIYQGALPKQ